MTLVEQIRISRNDPYFGMLDGFCFASKNLYNQAIYRVRQDFCAGNGYTDYNAIDASFKADNGLNNSDYKNMPTAASSQQTLKVVHNTWISFFKARKAYKANPGSFTGKPRIPGYLDKVHGRQVVVLPGQSVTVRDGIIHFPKAFRGFELRFRFEDRQVRQVRFVPHADYITAEIIYQVEEAPLSPDNGRYFGVDLGVSNIAVISSNVMAPVIINGGKLKSINRLYNKQVAHYVAVETAMHPVVHPNGSTHCRQTNRLRTLTSKRNDRIRDALHKISKYIVDLAVENGISRIVIGRNTFWKKEISLGSRTNQAFTQIPHALLISMICYKARRCGIEVIVVEESYTSKTSHLDGEQPVKHESYKGKRIHRGLFRTADGTLVNADANGAAQIMRKVFPEATAYGIGGAGVHPVKVAIA